MDYIIPPKEEIIDGRFYGKHFQIRFDCDDSNYYIKDLGHGFGTFIKITNWTEIKNKFLINIGENYIAFTLGLEEDGNETKESNNNNINNINNINNNNISNTSNLLNIKVFYGLPNHDILTFSPEKSPFHIGRSEECEIVLNDNMLSRIHCSIEFKNNVWFINDGYENGGEIIKSTNGTWMYPDFDIKIEDKMVFKSNRNLFFCSFEEN